MALPIIGAAAAGVGRVGLASALGGLAKDAVVGAGTVEKDVRKCETVVISYPHVIQKNKKVRLKLDKYIFLSVSKCIQEYNAKFPHCKIEEDSGYELLKYLEGCFYTQHTDSYKARPRAVSCSFILNDDFEGGDFLMFDGKKLKLTTGDVIVFPSNFLYPHAVTTITKGTRYSCVSWGY